MIKKFIIRKSVKFTGIKKLPGQTKPKIKTFTDEFRLLKQHRAEKLARSTEYKAMDIGLKRIRAQSLKLFGGNKIKTKQAKGIIQRGEIRAIKLARKKGIQKLESKSSKLSVPIRRFGSQKSKFVQKLSDSEARELGFPPREVFKLGGKKTPMSKIDRAIDTYSRAEKMNPRTGKFETFRKYDVKPIDPVASFYRKKRK